MSTEYLIAHIGHTIREHEHVNWWKPNSRGYTICTSKAGRYTEAEARSICAGPKSTCLAVRVEDVQPLIRSTPYYRRLDGSLNGLYDGAPHHPVPNNAQAWAHLTAARLDCGRIEKPTPISPSKSRAIYLDGLPFTPAEAA
jgi:hypothetical protein